MTDGDPVAGARGEDAARDPQFVRLLEKLHAEHGFDFRDYKPTSLARRVRTRMQHVHAASFEAYIAYLDAHPDEHAALFNTILINVTSFFRDPEAWSVIADQVIPRLVEEAGDTRALRLWSAGCSSGEEAFSLAMLLHERLGNRASDLTVKIYATDVDADALHAARHGLYRADQLQGVPPALLDKYFTPEDNAYRFRRDVRRWVIFGHHNLAHDPPLSHIDLLVYAAPRDQHMTIEDGRFRLNRGRGRRCRRDHGDRRPRRRHHRPRRRRGARRPGQWHRGCSSRFPEGLEMDSERSVVAAVPPRIDSWNAWPVSWSALWIGALAALATALLIGLIGTAVGAHQLKEGRIVTTGGLRLLTIVFSVAGAFFSAVVGGWVAARIAGIQRAETAMLHGAIVWLLGVPFVLLLAGLGVTGYFGAWYAGFLPAARTAADAVAMRNAALGGVTALLIGLVGGVIGGWMASGEPMTLTAHRLGRLEGRRRRDIAA